MRRILALFITSLMLFSCSSEYQGHPQVSLIVSNNSPDRQLFIIVNRSNISEEESLRTRGFSRVTPGEERVLGLGERNTENHDEFCFQRGESLLIIESPSGINPPFVDADDNQVNTRLLDWVPDARVWKSYPQGVCFDDFEQRIDWPE